MKRYQVSVNGVLIAEFYYEYHLADFVQAIISRNNRVTVTVSEVYDNDL